MIGIACVFSFLLNFQTHAQSNTKQPLNAAILLFDGVQIIDYTGPYELLGGARFNVYTVAEKRTITTAFGMSVNPTYILGNEPKPDILVIPGGGNITPGAQGEGVGAQLENITVIDWIKKRAKESQYVMSVCNGAFLLAKAGLLEGLRSTTTSFFIKDLKSFSPNTIPVWDERVVDNGKILTTAGLSAGMDGALHLIGKILGKAEAQGVALGIEYNWQPESGYARAALADTKLPGAIYEVFYSANARLVTIDGDKRQWNEVWLIPSTKPAKQVLDEINKKWAADQSWNLVTSKDNANSKSEWKLADKNGVYWRATVEVKSTGTNQLNIAFEINKTDKISN
ncbi:DJ-1/PfpI family protein [bacterium]|nr:DJ-1/PfpI family protein [bacterium]